MNFSVRTVFERTTYPWNGSPQRSGEVKLWFEQFWVILGGLGIPSPYWAVPASSWLFTRPKKPYWHSPFIPHHVWLWNVRHILQRQTILYETDENQNVSLVCSFHLYLLGSHNICLAQIRFVINVPKQVMKPKGYIATLITLILIIRSWTERDLF